MGTRSFRAPHAHTTNHTHDGRTISSSDVPIDVEENSRLLEEEPVSMVQDVEGWALEHTDPRLDVRQSQGAVGRSFTSWVDSDLPFILDTNTIDVAEVLGDAVPFSDVASLLDIHRDVGACVCQPSRWEKLNRTTKLLLLLFVLFDIVVIILLISDSLKGHPGRAGSEYKANWKKTPI